MQLIVVIGVIAALIYYVLKMRASAKPNDDDSESSDEQGFMSDMFISSNGRASTSKHEKPEEESRSDNGEISAEHIQGDPYCDLEKIAVLYEKGILTQEEFTAKKKDILERI